MKLPEYVNLSDNEWGASLSLDQQGRVSISKDMDSKLDTQYFSLSLEDAYKLKDALSKFILNTEVDRLIARREVNA